MPTIWPENITEIIHFEILRCENYVTVQENNSPRGRNPPNHSNPLYTKDPPVLKTLRVVNLLSVVYSLQR